MMMDQIYVKPETVEEAIQIACQHMESFQYMAGGTDVLVNKFQGNTNFNCLIDISGIKELKEVQSTGTQLKIGSLICLDALKTYAEIRNEFPSILEAAYSVASPMIRKTATLGGNLLCENRCSFYNQSVWWREAIGYCLKCDGDTCIATGGKKACFSKFVSDTAPVLISMEAQIEISDRRGTHLLALETIYTGDGINPRNLPKEAIIRQIVLPRDKKFITVFRKLRPREAVDFTSLTTAVSLDDSGTIRIALGGVDPKPVLVSGSLIGDSAELIIQALKKSRVIDNDIYSRTYRREMIKVFLKESLDLLQNIDIHA